MIVSEFIDWLKTQDQGAVVEILYHTSGTGYYDQGGTVSVKEFDPPEEGYSCPMHFEYTDYRGNQFVKEDAPWYNKRTLLLGTKDN